MYAVIAGFAGFFAIVVWWLFFSRAAWFDRIAAIVVMIAAIAATFPFLDVSLATGAMGMIFPMLAVPGICLAFVIWAVVSRRVVDRRAASDHGRGHRRRLCGVDDGSHGRFHGRLRQRSRVAMVAHG